MTRDEARALWCAHGLTLDVITDADIEDLRERLDAEMRAHAALPGFRANRVSKVRIPGKVQYADITCRSDRFLRREAVTFERNGFVGFAGWADHENVQPVLRAFTAWVEALVERVQA